MKIYRITAKRIVDYYIAVEDNQNPLVIAENNLDDAFDLAQVSSMDIQEMDVFDKRLDGIDIYDLDFDELEELRERMRGEK